MKAAAVIFFMLFIACNGNNKKPIPGGGRCTYSTSSFRFTIVAVEKDSASSAIQVLDTMNPIMYPPDSLFHVRIKLCCDQMRSDTIYLHNITHTAITVADAHQYGLKEGAVIDGTVDRIESGTCTPEIYKFNNRFLN
jgi:hypothetical protein